jgi:hypothetical protein
MTAKTLSWMTFGLLATSALPFLADPSVASAASSDLARTDRHAYGSVLPNCGACHVQPDQEYRKWYAIDRNALCPSDLPYRVVVRIATKVICQYGSYWMCSDTSSMECSTFVERPECPNDSCARAA